MYPCGDCGKQVRWNQQAVQCDACQKWLHTKCLNISPINYSILQQSDDPWICPSCYCSFLPFANCSTISIASRSDSSVESAPGVTTASSPSGLRLYYCNSRSLLPKMDDVRTAVALSRFDILAFTETWFDIGTRPCEISIPSYTLLHRDKVGRGGGMCLFIHDSLPVVSQSMDQSSELLSATVRTSQGLLLVVVYYRPPGVTSYLNQLESALHKLDLANYKKVIILGDFNIDLLQSSKAACVDLLGVMSAFGLSQVVASATRMNANTSTLLDHVYVSEPSMVVSCKVHPPLQGSDHNSVLVNFSFEITRSPPVTTRRVWLHKRADFEAINDDLSTALPVVDELTISDIDGAWNVFQHLFLSTLKRHIPQRSMSGKKKQVPWLTALVLRRISKRNAARKLAKRKDTPSMWQRFRCLRNKAVEAVRAATSRTVRHINSCPLYQPFVKTSYHLNSFFISVIPLWNSNS